MLTFGGTSAVVSLIFGRRRRGALHWTQWIPLSFKPEKTLRGFGSCFGNFFEFDSSGGRNCLRYNAGVRRFGSFPAKRRRCEARPLFPDLPGNRKIAVICGSGYRSSIAASMLQARGYNDLENVTGGMAEYGESDCG